MRVMLLQVSRVLLLAGLVAAPVSAEVVRIEVQSRSDLLAGQAFGAAGAYEKIAGKIFFAVDPALPANRIVTDLDKAPRNAAGKVEFSSDFFLIKPKQIERGNGAVLYEVSNRGGKGMLGFFNHASGSVDPGTAAELGDGFLMRQGFTLLWSAGSSTRRSGPVSCASIRRRRPTTAVRSAAWSAAKRQPCPSIAIVPGLSRPQPSKPSSPPAEHPYPNRPKRWRP